MKYTRNALGLLNAQYRSVLKKCLLINLGLFALGAGVSTADAVTLSPTLDSLKAEAQKKGAVSEEYNLKKLDANAKVPEGDAAVRIGKNVYYFSPKGGEDAKLLSILAGTPVASVDNAANPSTIKFDVTNIATKFPSSVFEYKTGTENDHNFVVQEADQDGKLTPKYYKIVLKTNEIGTSEAIKWSTESAGATGSVEVKLPNSDTPTKLYYTVDESKYDPILGTRLTDLTDDVGSAKKVLFKGVNQTSDSSSVYGGAIYNPSTDGYNIYADFIGNYTSATATSSYTHAYAYGGAIYNSGTIGDIIGDFIGNYVSATATTSSYAKAYGGAIYNDEKGTIGNITGDFIGNYAYSDGGAIYNNRGTIGNITGDFIVNKADAGGAIYNRSGTIGT